MGDVDLVAGMVERSLPRTGRPRLSTEIEQRLAPVERQAAVQYAGLETYALWFNALADAMSEPEDAIPSEQDWEDSLAVDINDARIKLIESALAHDSRPRGQNP